MRKAPDFAEIYPDENKWGSLTGTIRPPEAGAEIFLSGNASIQLTIDSSGTVQAEEIPAGEYTVDIIPVDYNYGSYTISNVIVYADSITNIGTITLDYYGSAGSGCEIGWGRQMTGK